MQKRLLKCYLDSRRTPLGQLTGAEQLHQRLHAQSKSLYLNLLGDSSAHLSHRVAVFVGVIRDPKIATEEIELAVCDLPRNKLLQLLEALRVNRINGKRASRVGLRLLFRRDDLPHFAAFHRQRLLRVIKHLLGERTWASVKRALAQPNDETSQRFLDRAVVRFTENREILIQSLSFVAGFGFPAADERESSRKKWLVIPWLQKNEASEIHFKPTLPVLIQSLAVRRNWKDGNGLPRQTLSGLRGTYFADTSSRNVLAIAGPKPSTATPDGPVTASIKSAMRGESKVVSPPQTQAKASTRIAVVLDSSASMASSGERLNHPAALAQAITKLIGAAVEEVGLTVVGGKDPNGVVHPGGESDLANALMTAVATMPDAVSVVTDGYENSRQGDFANVIRGLRELGWETPVYQVVPLFAEAEDLSDRTLSDEVPVMPIVHEKQSGELIARALLETSGEELTDAEVDQFCRFAMV